MRPNQAKGAYTGGVGGGAPTPEQVVAALYPEWSPDISYAVNSFVVYQGLIYMSRVGSNAGNVPASSPSEWFKFGSTPADTQAAAMKFFGDVTEPWG